MPQTPLTLRLSLSLRTIDKRELGIFLAFMADEVRRQIPVHGADGVFPTDSWEYEWASLQQRYQTWRFLAFSSNQPRLTWGILRDVLEGLRLYLERGGHNRQAYFKIERRGEGGLEFVGLGRLYRSKDPHGLSEAYDFANRSSLAIGVSNVVKEI